MMFDDDFTIYSMGTKYIYITNAFRIDIEQPHYEREPYTHKHKHIFQPHSEWILFYL